MRLAIRITLPLLLSTLCSAEEIWVPDDHLSIQAAIVASKSGDEVIVRAGTYVERIDFLGKAITVRSESGVDVTTIDGNQQGSVVTFTNGEGPGSILEGFLIYNGSRNAGGGGIFCELSSPTIRGNEIRGNAARTGGGLYLVDCGGEIRDNRITGNLSDIAGGGIHCSGTLTVEDNIIELNRSQQDGGGIFTSSDTVSILNNWIRANTALREGGGILLSNASPRIENNEIEGNYAGEAGGAIAMRIDSAPTIESNWFLRNTTSGAGGGIYAYDHSAPVVLNNLFELNSALSGGGLYFENASPAIINNTIVRNQANVGGGVSMWNQGWASIENSIIAHNYASSGAEVWVGCFGFYPHLNLSYSDILGGQTAMYVAPGAAITWGPGMIGDEPQFVSLFGVYRLKQTPPQSGVTNLCVDGGNPASSLIFGTTRSDGVPDAGIVDMGYHYEVQLASATYRNAGTNPASYDAATLPVLGTTYTGTIDLQGTSGHDFAWLTGFHSPLSFILGGGQALLVNILDPSGELLLATAKGGPVASYDLLIPVDPHYAGVEAYTQALQFGGISTFALSNAQDLVLGY